MREAKGQGRYNVVVIGGGTAGLVTAAGTAGLGGRVALVERHLMGGDCLNTGCVPSKALIASARVAHSMRHAARWGLPERPVEVDLGAVLRRMRERRAHLAPHDSAERFESLGVDVFRGAARLVSPHEVEVDGGPRLNAVHIVIATGASPTLPPIEGLAAAKPFTHETVFDELPDSVRRLVIIGGGPIGCELGQAFARLGVEVTLLEAAPTILAREDDDVRACVEAALVADGVRVQAGAKIARVTVPPGGGVRVELETGGVEADAVLVATGRKPRLAGLGLVAAGVAVDEKTGTLVTDAYLRSTTQPHIFAAGDVVGGAQLTSLADHHARVVVRNILFPWLPTRAHDDSPACTYTSPEIARVGATEADLRRAQRPYDVVVQDFAGVDRAVLESEERGFAKVLVAKGRDRILGATLVGEHAGELIHEIALAVRLGRGLSAIGGLLHAYPTRAEAARKVADLYQRRRLTPRVRQIFGALYRWHRRG